MNLSLVSVIPDFVLLILFCFALCVFCNWFEGGNVEFGVEVESGADGLLYSERMAARND